MSTTTLAGSRNPKILRRDRAYDHYFLAAMAILILVTVFVGFAQTYFLAGVCRAPLPNLLIHIHGVVFWCWIFLLITQIALVSAPSTTRARGWRLRRGSSISPGRIKQIA